MTDRAPLVVALVTLGDPATMTGGYLYHLRFTQLAPAQGARVEFVSFPRRPFPLPVLAGADVLRHVRRLAADVVLLDSIAAAFLAPWLTAHPLPVPLVGSLHQPPGGIDHAAPRRHVQARLDRWAYRHAVRLVVASEALADELLEEGVPEHLLRVVPPGRDVAGEAVPPRGDLRAGRRAALLCVGNWVARKGLLDLLEAVATLPPDAVTLHLVGATDTEPDYGRRVRARLAAVDLRERTVVHGVLPPSEVSGLYAAADVFALASTREPYGTVYGEAMAAGLPVVGWAAGNLPHLARDGVDGRIAPVGDRGALAEALRDLVYDESLRRRLGQAARRRAAGFPTWVETTQMLVAELRSAVERAA